MLPIYNPAVGAFVSTAGAQSVSPEILLLNILIELRAANEQFNDAQRGVVTQTMAQYRLDAVNET